jgi:uncharacterized membrane protein YkoI
MKRRTKILGAGAVAVAAIGAGATIAAASGGDDAESGITGPDLAKASAAALDHTGQGTVTGTEVGDEDSYYEVEVTLRDGSQVDVQLDRSFAVVDTMPDKDTGADADNG